MTQSFEPQAGTALQNGSWTRLRAGDSAAIIEAETAYGIKLDPSISHAVEENGFVLLPVVLPLRDRDRFVEVMILMAIGPDRLITVEPDHPVALMQHAAERLAQLPASAGGTIPMALIIEALIDASHEAVDAISIALDALADEAKHGSGGFDLKGRQVGVADIADIAVDLGQAEELIAHTVQGQLMIERAIRWLRRRMKTTDIDAATMLSDIQGGRRHAQFQHAKVRNVQQSLMTTLDLKQNQIIKVFTIVTAVFTPPTLIAGFYGQNFAYMPELSIPWGEWAIMASTAFFALMPLAYIKRKGWLR